MSPLTLSSTLGALRKAGSVFGVIFTRQNEVLFSDAPFIPERIYEMANVLDDIAFYFQKESRHADQLAFGYDGGNLVVVTDELFRIIVLHSMPDECDFIAKAARAFLKDYQMSLFAENMRDGQTAEQAQDGMLRHEIPHQTPEEVIREEAMRPVTQRVTLKAEQAVDPTAPINPVPSIPQTAPVTPVAPAMQNPSTGYADELPQTDPVTGPEAGSVEPITPVPMQAQQQQPVFEDLPKQEQEVAPEEVRPVPAREEEEEPETEGASSSDESESQTVMLSREHTAPILAANQPASTLPPPRMPKRRDG